MTSGVHASAGKPRPLRLLGRLWAPLLVAAGGLCLSLLAYATPAVVGDPPGNGTTSLALGLVATAMATAFVVSARRHGRRFERLTDDLWATLGALAREMSSRAHASAELQESEARYRMLVERMSEGIIIIDENAVITYANRSMHEMLGRAAGELVGRCELDLLDSAGQAILRAQLDRRRAGSGEAYEMRWRRDDGRDLVTLVSPEPLLAPDGSYAGSFAVFSDVTERVRTAEAVQRRDAVLDAITRAASELMRSTDLDATLARIIAMMGVTVGVSRALAFRDEAQPDGRVVTTLRHEWRQAGIPSLAQDGRPGSFELAQIGLGRWLGLLPHGQAVAGKVAELPESERRRFDEVGCRSILAVPVISDGRWWGHLGFDDCESEREWLPAEIDALRTLADLVGMTVSRARTHEALADANLIVENSPTVLYRAAAAAGWPLQYVSRNAGRLGLDATALLGLADGLASLIHPDDLATHEAALERAIAERQAHLVRQYRLRAGDGSYRWVEDRLSVVRDGDGAAVAVEGILSDISERKRGEEQIAHLARHDALTDLPNRATFMERVAMAMAQARRDGPSFAVLFVDVDHFKDVNDTRGHATGDLMLKEIAARLVRTARTTDTVARLGGDEFAILQAGIDDPAAAAAMAQRILDTLSTPIDVGDAPVISGASIGIAVCGAGAGSADTIMMQADMALYRAKEDGRGAFRFHTQEIDTSVRSRVLIASELREAIAGGQLYLDYQPQVELATGAITGVEALVRWRHPVRGLIPPGDFIPVAEATGLILPLGSWVLDEALRQARAWLDAGIPPVTMAVNLSGAQLKSPGLEREVRDALQAHGYPAALLELELTETVFMQATQGDGDILRQLRELGVHFAIDDFGTGYSSLEYLRNFEVDRLKIARNFVCHLSRKASDRSIVSATIGLGKALGMKLLAEGVETPEQTAFLRDAGCDEVQGFLFSRPVTPDAVASLLRQPAPFLPLTGSAGSTLRAAG